MAAKTVDEYIEGVDGWQREVVSTLRQIVREAAPKAKESIKWAQPVYEESGPFAYIKAFNTSVNFGFWRGADLPDPLGMLQGEGEKMRHVRLMGIQDVNKKAFEDLVRAAVQLNREKGDPTKG